MTRKRKKLAIILLCLICCPFLFTFANNIMTFYYDSSYSDINKGASSMHYKIEKIDIPGTIKEQTAKADVTYTGYVYIDTLENNIKLETTNTNSKLLIIDPKGKIIATHSNISNNYSADLKNCLLLKDELVLSQRWLDKSQPIYISHFSKVKFNSDCFDPLRTWGNPNGSERCYPWDGIGYYNITFHNEKLKFKLPCQSKSILFSNNYDYSGGINYYSVPKRFQSKLNAAFLVYNQQVYMISEK